MRRQVKRSVRSAQLFQIENCLIFWNSSLTQSSKPCTLVRTNMDENHRHKRIHRLLNWPGLPALFWLSSYVNSQCLAVSPQSGAKQIFYCTVHYITLNSNCEAQRASKNVGKKCWKIELKAKNNAWLIWV